MRRAIDLHGGEVVDAPAFRALVREAVAPYRHYFAGSLSQLGADAVFQTQVGGEQGEKAKAVDMDA